MPAFFMYLGDICPPAITGKAWMSYAFFSFVFNLIFPIIFKSEKSFIYGIPVMLGIILVNFLIVLCYFIETYGLEKSLIYKKIRGIKFNKVSIDDVNKE